MSAYCEGATFSVGTVIGSNIYNILAIIGLVAIPVPIRVSRVEGAILLTGYIGFVYVLLLSRGL